MCIQVPWPVGALQGCREGRLVEPVGRVSPGGVRRRPGACTSGRMEEAGAWVVVRLFQKPWCPDDSLTVTSGAPSCVSPAVDARHVLLRELKGGQ